MPRALALVFVLSLALLHSVDATYEIWGGDFETYAKSTEIVVLAKVKEFGKKTNDQVPSYESMTLEVLEVVKGKFVGSKIILNGDSTGLTPWDRIDSHSYKVGGTYLLALYSAEPEQLINGSAETSLLYISGVLLRHKKYVDRLGEYSESLEDVVERIN